jgi:hypothetical protein
MMDVSTAYSSRLVKEFQYRFYIPFKVLGTMVLGKLANSVYSWKLVAPCGFSLSTYYN